MYGFESETITIYATAINEGCDEFNHLWSIDSTSSPNFNSLTGELLYSKSVSEYLSANNLDTNNRTNNLVATGNISKTSRTEHYTCRDTWFFITNDFQVGN